jgi:hypothetical protein
MYQENSMGFGGGLYGLIAVLVVLFLFGGGNWNGNGNAATTAALMAGSANSVNQNTIELLKGQQNLQNTMNNNALAQLQTANANNISQLITANNNNISQLQANHQAELAQLGGFANLSQQIANQTSSMQLLGANIMSQQQQCCCETQKELIRMGDADQLAICRQTNEIENVITNTSNLVRTDLQQLGYNLNQATTAIIAANNAGVQAIKDLCNNHWTQDLQQKLIDAKGELSQNQQTLLLTNQLNAIAAAIAKIPTTAAAGA